MVLAITYGDENFSQSLKDNLKTAIKRGKVDEVMAFGPGSISQEFRKENEEILSAQRGAGYWLWKPYIINQAIEKIDFGDYLVYSDSGSFYMKDIHILIEFMQSKETDIFLGELEHLESKYSKRDAFVFLGVEGLGFEQLKQYEASFILVKKTEKICDFLDKWLLYCRDIRIISDNPNECGLDNYPDFVQNRYDQTVLSLLAKKYGYNGFRPVDIKRKTDDPFPYPQIMVRTRFRNCNPIKYRIKFIKKEFMYLFGV